jgi:hypothetical protein
MYGFSEPITSQVISDSFLKRLELAYCYSFENSESLNSPVWNDITNLNFKIHEALLRGNGSSREYLENPSENDLYYGVDCLASKLIANIRSNPEPEIANIKEIILKLCEAIGFIGLQNPEGRGARENQKATEIDSYFIHDLLSYLNSEYGIPKGLPNPFRDEFGVETDFGILSYRMLHAFYQVIIVSKLASTFSYDSVLEIGPGMGRTSGLLHLMGYNVKTIDLPIGVVGTALYLHHVLGEREICLPGESKTGRAIELNSNYRDNSKTFKNTDLVLNVDSITEMNILSAEGYLENVVKYSKSFLSINHEVNLFSVFEITQKMKALKNVSRTPYWIRPGYCQEFYLIDQEKFPNKKARRLQWKK